MKTIKKLALKLDDFRSDYGLVFDQSKILDTCQKLSTDLSGYSVHFSVKSFPSHDFLKTISPFIDGWDISTLRELDYIRPLIGLKHSLWLTNGDTKVLSQALDAAALIYYTLDNTTDLSYDYPEKVNLGLRLDPYDLLQRGHSRYGFLLSQVSELPPQLKKRIKFLHCHCPGVITGKELNGIRSAMNPIIQDFPNLKLINLGGGLTSCNIDSFEMLKEIYEQPKLALEPGRWFSESAGSAFSKIDSIFEKEGDLYLVGKLSPDAHLKWARGMSYTFINLGHEKIYSYKRLIYSSSNALESDQIILKQTPGNISIVPGDWLVLEKIPGYSVAWNHEFNGVPQAPVFFIE